MNMLTSALIGALLPFGFYTVMSFLLWQNEFKTPGIGYVFRLSVFAAIVFGVAGAFNGGAS